jgi:curli biogenesis system outer membrane secretion channel CsgG
MNTTTRGQKRLAFLGAAFLCVACSAPLGTPNLEVFPPPYVPITPARTTIVPSSQFMKVAVFNFVDQTGKGDALVESLADMLATELHRSGRFEIYDRGELRHYDYGQMVDQCQKMGGDCAKEVTPDEASAGGNMQESLAYLANAYNQIMQDTDAVLTCAITSISEGRAKFDCRLINARSKTVMTAGTFSASYSSGGASLDIERGGIARTADEIQDALPKPSTGKLGKVLVQDGPVLTISMGRKDGIIAGMNVFVIGPGRVLAGQDGAATTVDEVYLAQAYVVSVYDNTSQVVVFLGNDFRVGDSVRFK